mgnify:CR=1 FL=1
MAGSETVASVVGQHRAAEGLAEGSHLLADGTGTHDAHGLPAQQVAHQAVLSAAVPAAFLRLAYIPQQLIMKLTHSSATAWVA